MIGPPDYHPTHALITLPKVNTRLGVPQASRVQIDHYGYIARLLVDGEHLEKLICRQENYFIIRCNAHQRRRTTYTHVPQR